VGSSSEILRRELGVTQSSIHTHWRDRNCLTVHLRYQNVADKTPFIDRIRVVLSNTQDKDGINRSKIDISADAIIK
jgi:hypothetical protein